MLCRSLLPFEPFTTQVLGLINMKLLHWHYCWWRGILQ